MIEFARNQLGLAGANSSEFEPGAAVEAVIFMPEGSTTHKGGTMRLGLRKTLLSSPHCLAARLYQALWTPSPPCSYCSRPNPHQLALCRLRKA